MITVNLIEADRICDQQLKAEYKLIKKIIKLARIEFSNHGRFSFFYSKNFPKTYCTGGLHNCFFFDKMKFICKRFNEVLAEIKERDLFEPKSKEIDLDKKSKTFHDRDWETIM